jgi:hypothetical protein
VLDSLFGKKAQSQPGAAKAPVTASTAAAAAAPSLASPMPGPLEVGKELMGEDFQNVVDEAAIVCAAGEERSAADMLIAFLRQTNGHANQRVWFMLLDIYQALDEREQYEKLALMFANRFKTSPPSWEQAIGLGAAPEAKPAASGRNVLIIEGVAGDHLGARSRDFIAASREMKTCKIDISRMRMEQSPMEGIAALQSIMAQLRKHKVAATLMGESHAVGWLGKKILDTKSQADPGDSPYWMLLLEILQWRGLMESFEDLSLEYTITFEVSGPGWDDNGSMAIEAGGSDGMDSGSSSDEIVPEDIITDVVVQRMQEAISLALAERGVARLNFQRVRRMDFVSAGTFLNILSDISERGLGKVILDQPSELILALGEVVGFTTQCSCVSIVPRKR